MFFCRRWLVCRFFVMSSDCVLIGVPDEKIGSRRSNLETNKIGGVPDLPDGQVMQQKCLRCGRIQLLVVQIYCPLHDSDYHRVIYVFCCSQKDCWSENDGWSVMRVQHKDTKQSVTSTINTKTNFSWDDGDDDWGDEGEVPDEKVGTSQRVDTPTHDVSDNLEQLTLCDEPTVSHENHNHGEVPCFESYYVNVLSEDDLIGYDATHDKHIKTLIEDYESNTQNTQTDLHQTEELSLTSCEPYEKSEHRDKNFHVFSKKTSMCREQVVRYSHLGEPLLLSDAELPPVGKCERCGCQLAFEFQLMPGLIPYLIAKDDNEGCVEFGSILVFTCRNSCWDDVTMKAVPERALYFPDPDLKFFKTQRT